MKSARVYLVIRCIVLLCSTYVFGDMTSSSNPALVGQVVNFTVQINAPSGISAVPTGSVTLVDGGTVLGTANLQNGATSITATFAVEGDHSIVANYSGDQNFQPLSTAPLLERITTSDAFTIAVAPSAVGQHAGGASDVKVTVFANGTSPAGVQLSCEDLPPGAACSFAPSIIQPTVDGQTTTMTITSTGSQVAINRVKKSRTFAFIWPAVLGGLFMITPLRKWNGCTFFVGALCFLCVLSVSGCGNTLKIVQGGTPAGSYTIQLVGNSGIFAQSTPMIVNITP